MVREWDQSFLATESMRFQLSVQSKAYLECIHTVRKKKSIFKTQTSNWTQSGLWFVLPGFLSSAYQNISKQSTDHLRLPDINSILLPTPCSHLIAFEIAQCPTWKDYYSNAGSSFYQHGGGWVEWHRKSKAERNQEYPLSNLPGDSSLEDMCSRKWLMLWVGAPF